MLPQLQQNHLSTVASKTSDFFMILSLSSQLRLHAFNALRYLLDFRILKPFF